jgi:hypothetical protein
MGYAVARDPEEFSAPNGFFHPIRFSDASSVHEEYGVHEGATALLDGYQGGA